MSFFFFFNDTATTEIYTLSLHDALPISPRGAAHSRCGFSMLAWEASSRCRRSQPWRTPDRKSTRLNSSHEWISYAVFCLKKKNETRDDTTASRLIALLTPIITRASHLHT